MLHNLILHVISSSHYACHLILSCLQPDQMPDRCQPATIQPDQRQQPEQLRHPQQTANTEGGNLPIEGPQYISCLRREILSPKLAHQDSSCRSQDLYIPLTPSLILSPVGHVGRMRFVLVLSALIAFRTYCYPGGPPPLLYDRYTPIYIYASPYVNAIYVSSVTHASTRHASHPASKSAVRQQDIYRPTYSLPKYNYMHKYIV